MTYAPVHLNKKQINSLSELCKKYAEEPHIYQHMETRIVVVEFTFPYRYIIASNGRIISDHA
jgi:hypothetical protein